MTLASAIQEPPAVLERLQAVCGARGLTSLGETLGGLQGFVRDDLLQVEAALSALDAPDDRVGKSATHLVDLGGKRLRPLCVALAARVGTGFSAAALDLAVAVELVHSATLLHDDVVDLGDRRRGAPAARVIYGNAASIFAGDWLLIEALRRVRAATVPGTLDRLLSVIEVMIAAEAEQLHNRGRLDLSPDRYFAIIEGKTASLFAWAMHAGGRAGGASDAQCADLEGFGTNLGLAFQLIDDALDFAGEAAATGKSLFGDLREGKMTYPLIIGLERSVALRGLLRLIVETAEGQAIAPAVAGEVLAHLSGTGAIECTVALAHELAAKALGHLEALGDHPARCALTSICDAAVHRRW